MSDSPIGTVLRVLDSLDLEATVSMFAPDGRLLNVYGQVAEGRDQVRTVLGAFNSALRLVTHTVTSEWNPEPGVWIAELDATYELRNQERLGPYPRAIVLREGSDGIADLRIYGSHEHRLGESRGYVEVAAGPDWLPTL